MRQEKSKGLTQSSKGYQYTVHPSQISQTSFRVIKKVIGYTPVVTTTYSQSNPYFYKPKSYSTKRQFNPEPQDDIWISQTTKKVKKDVANTKKNDIQASKKLDLQKIRSQLNKVDKEYFTFETEPLEKEQKIIEFQAFNYEYKGKINKQLNSMLNKEIQIISNKNEKISVPIHDALIKANTNQSKVQKNIHFLQGIENPFEYQKKNQYTQSMNFIKDYKNGYAPIDMQLNNSDNANQTYMGSQSKTHFIRKKQSTLSLPRSCGVSYIKPSESKQTSPFDPLPPLIFQCSSSCSDNNQIKDKYQQMIEGFLKVNQTCWLPYIKTDQCQMRALLLGQRIGTVGWVQGIQNSWPLFTDSTFVLIPYSTNFPKTQEQVWTSLKTCFFKIGILSKKSTSGKKAFLKSVGIQLPDKQDSTQDKNNITVTNSIINEQIEQNVKIAESQNDLQKKKSGIALLSEDLANELKDCRTVITLSFRLQLYVEQQDWKNFTKLQKNILNTFIMSLKQNLEKKSLSIIKDRLDIAKLSQKQEQMKVYLTKLRKKKYSNQQNSITTQNSEVVEKQQFIPENFLKMLKIYQQNNLKICQQLQQQTILEDYQTIIKGKKNQTIWQKSLKMPIYYISTRDSFAFDLIQKITTYKRMDHYYQKVHYYFDPDNLPTNFVGQYRRLFPQFDTGIVSYHNFFTNQQLVHFEQKTYETQLKAFKNHFLQMTVQPSIVGTKIKRTKFFFGYRYMWTRCQLAQPTSYVGAGVRKDVTASPPWIKQIENPLVQHGIVQKDFLNSIAINVYHDGKEGLAQHFDDAVRFKQPIFTLRLFSDARLSFGSQFYGFCNGAFIIPLPRGCICVMEENSYAANGVKHCVRPCDMTGKSAAVILRQIHSQVVEQATKYDEYIDVPAWLSTLSDSQNAVSFAQQKRRQADYLLLNKE